MFMHVANRWKFFLATLLWMGFSTLHLHAEHPPDDEWQAIKSDLHSMPEDSAKVERFIDAGYYAKNRLSDSVDHFADLALQLAQKVQYPKGAVSAWVLKGSFANAQNRFSDAIHYYGEAIDINNNLNNPVREAQIKDNLANVFLNQGKFDSSLAIKFEALEIFHTHKDSASLAITYAGIGTIYQEKQDYRRSANYSIRGLAYDKSPQRALTLGNIGAAMKNLGQLDSAIYYYRQAATLLPQYRSFSGRNFNNVALLYMDQQQFDSANWYLEIARSNFEAINDTFDVARLDVSRAMVAMRQGHFQDGLRYAEGSESTILDRGSLKDKSRLYNVLSNLYAKVGQFEQAWQADRTQRLWQDSIDNVELNSRVEEIEIKYATSEKEKKILSQQLSLQQKSNQSRNRLYGLIAIGVLGFSIIYLLVQRSRIQGFKAQQAALKQEKAIEELEHHNQLMAMNAMVKGQEEERNRIAKDLHDGLGGLLSTVKIHFLTVQNELRILRGHKNYNKATELLDTACDEVRRIAHNMMPDVLNQFGLPATIEDLEESLEQKGLIVHTELINMEQRLPEELEINIYRIVQELLNNMLKYAQANKVIIQLSRQSEEIHLTIEDDGIGFDPKKKSEGIGIKNIYSRVAFLGGEVDIHTRPGQGTSVSIQIPLSRQFDLETAEI